MTETQEILHRYIRKKHPHEYIEVAYGTLEIDDSEEGMPTIFFAYKLKGKRWKEDSIVFQNNAWGHYKEG
jgi:hypothetical protein